LGLALCAAHAAARDRAPLFTRVGLGGGYGGVGSDVADDHTNNVGYALAWDGAIGGFVHPAVALHASWFGFYLPHSTTKYDESAPRRGSAWLQTLGGGFTLSPTHGFRRATRLRPFVSCDLGLSIVEDHLFLHNGLALGTQLLGGFELRLDSGLGIGLALQASYHDMRASNARPIQAGHVAGLLTFSFDTRPRTTSAR
jgi:hypothetical protein